MVFVRYKLLKHREENEKCLDKTERGDLAIHSTETVLMKIHRKAVYTLYSKTSTGIYSKAFSAKDYRTLLTQIFRMGCIKPL